MTTTNGIPDPSKFNSATDEFHLNLSKIASDPSNSSYNSQLASLLLKFSYSTLGEILCSFKGDQIEYLVKLIDEIATLPNTDKKVQDFTLLVRLCVQAEGIPLTVTSTAENIPLVGLGIVVESLARKGLVEIDYKKFSLSTTEEFVKIKE